MRYGATVLGDPNVTLRHGKKSKLYEIKYDYQHLYHGPCPCVNHPYGQLRSDHYRRYFHGYRIGMMRKEFISLLLLLNNIPWNKIRDTRHSSFLLSAYLVMSIHYQKFCPGDEDSFFPSFFFLLFDPWFFFVSFSTRGKKGNSKPGKRTKTDIRSRNEGSNVSWNEEASKYSGNGRYDPLIRPFFRLAWIYEMAGNSCIEEDLTLLLMMDYLCPNVTG